MQCYSAADLFSKPFSRTAKKTGLGPHQNADVQVMIRKVLPVTELQRELQFYFSAILFFSN
jgi:hypothetical protein